MPCLVIGIQTLAASVVLTENETVDILDYLTSCCRGLHKDLQRKVDHGAKRVFRHLAFRRCKAKLEMPQGQASCEDLNDTCIGVCVVLCML